MTVIYLRIVFVCIITTFVLYTHEEATIPKRFPRFNSSAKFGKPKFIRDQFQNETREKVKKLKTFLQKNPSAKFDNPNFVRDRFKNLISKPEMPELWKDKYRKPFNSAWMDYCDPYHCNDYHKIACGLNRKTMRFKWFQSVCHIILNNMCANYRGSLKYDVIDTKFCRVYVMYLREGCPRSCKSEDFHPVCGISSVDNHVELFKNECTFHSANCASTVVQEYEEVDMRICEHYLRYSLSK